MRPKMRFLLLLLTPLPACAQTVDNTNEQYAMRYIREHLFMQNGEDFNVITADIEWPEVIHYQQPRTLQRFMLQTLLDIDTPSLDSAFQAYRDRHGQVVTTQLKELPDDKRFCYVTLSAKVLSHRPGQWISYLIESEAAPEAHSTVQARKMKKYITYDIAAQQILTADQMLRQEKFEDGSMDLEFYNTLFAPLTDEDYDNLKSMDISGAWFDNTGQTLGIHVTCTTGSRILSYDAHLPYEANKTLVTKKAKRLLTRKDNVPEPEYVTATQTWRGDSVYRTVDTMPVFMDGAEGLKRYISNTAMPSSSTSGKVYTSYVVDKEGRTQDVRVVGPLTPEADRHAANLIKGMPPYTPGKHQGKPVCVRMYVPIYYK